jgi:hypothetical protein
MRGVALSFQAKKTSPVSRAGSAAAIMEAGILLWHAEALIHFCGGNTHRNILEN